jgi:hypothetical protein
LRHSQQSIDVLKCWLEIHGHHVYPSKTVKLQLARSANLTIDQVSHWFFNQRKNKQTIEKKKHALVATKKLNKK